MRGDSNPGEETHADGKSAQDGDGAKRFQNTEGQFASETYQRSRIQLKRNWSGLSLSLSLSLSPILGHAKNDFDVRMCVNRHSNKYREKIR